MKQLSDFERHMKAVQKRQNDIESQKVIDQILHELKMKNEQMYQEKVDKARQDLEILMKSR